MKSTGFYVITFILHVFYIQNGSGLSCYVCGQTNLPPPGECTTQFQYDCSSADTNQQQPTRGPKMICRTSRSKNSANSYSVGKECVSEDEHFQRYPEGKAFGCETVFPNTTHEISYCICDSDYCNGKPIDEQIQQFRVFYEQSPAAQNQPPVNNQASRPAQLPNENVALLPQLQEALSLNGRDQQNVIIPAPLPNQQGQQQRLFGRTPPGGQNVLQFQNGQAAADTPLILTPPLILPNNSLLLPPYPTTVATVGKQTSTPFISIGNNGPQQILSAPTQERPVQANILQIASLNASSNSDQAVLSVPGIQSKPTVNQQQGLQNNSTKVAQQQRHDESPDADDQQQQPQPRNQWPILTVENHLQAQPTNGRQQEPELKLLCSACTENNLTAGGDCQKQITVDCSSALSVKSKQFCFTKDIVQKSGLHTLERRCASEEILRQELGLSVIHDSCGQTRPESPTEFRYCICSSTNSCNQIPFQQQLLLYTSPQQQQTPQNQQNPWLEHQQQQLAGVRQQTSSTVDHSSTTSLPENDSKTRCYVCGESDLQHAADCSQQYEYDCSKQYPVASNSKILCLTRQTKLANGLFSIEKRCIAESEHKQQYPGSARVVLDGCGEAWNGYVQYCVCDNNGELCNGPNITVQQSRKGYTPTDLHNAGVGEDPFTTTGSRSQQTATFGGKKVATNNGRTTTTTTTTDATTELVAFSTIGGKSRSPTNQQQQKKPGSSANDVIDQGPSSRERQRLENGNDRANGNNAENVKSQRSYLMLIVITRLLLLL